MFEGISEEGTSAGGVASFRMMFEFRNLARLFHWPSRWRALRLPHCEAAPPRTLPLGFLWGDLGALEVAARPDLPTLAEASIDKHLAYESASLATKAPV